MIRNEILQKYNIRYQDGMYGTEDYRFWAECSMYGFLGNIDEVMLYWRKTNAGVTNRELHTDERKKAVAETQKYLLEKLGFCLKKK